jgi:hypothetical protein
MNIDRQDSAFSDNSSIFNQDRLFSNLKCVTITNVIHTNYKFNVCNKLHLNMLMHIVFDMYYV